MKERIENALALRVPEAAENLSSAPPFVNTYQADADYEGVHLRDYWRSVRKRLWMVLGLAVLLTAMTIVIMLRRPNAYEATARVQVDLENANSMLGTSKNSSIVVNNATGDPAYFNTQLQILAGPGLLRRAVKALDLERNSAFLASAQHQSLWKKLERGTGLGGHEPDAGVGALEGIPLVGSSTMTSTREDLLEAERLAPYVDVLQRNLKIEPVKETRLPVKETRLIEISFTHGDRQTAARVVNAIADSFALANLEKKTSTNASSGDFLQKRIAELQSQIRGGEEKLIAYAKSNQILSLDASQNTVVDRLTGLNKQLLEAENERKLAEAAYRSAQAPGAANALAEENSKNIGDMEQKLTELQQTREQLLVKNTEEWPEVKEVSGQIALLGQKIKDMRSHATAIVLTNLETRYRQSFQREQALRSSFDQQRGETLTQNEAAINYRIIQQEIETNKNLLDGLLQRSKENDVVLAGTPNNVSVVDYAITPREPVGPQRLLGVVLAFVLSIIFGICLAIFLEYLDNTVRSADDVEKMLRLPALALIPTVVGLSRHRLLSFMTARPTSLNVDPNHPALLLNAEARSSIGEAYRQLRTSILLSTAGRAPKTLLITSGQPGEGKTTTAINTATSLAQTGARVLILDADMRRPAIHSSFNITNVAGLSTVLSREMEIADVLALIDVHEESKLHVMTSGAVPPNPAELLGSQQMKRLLKMLDPHFDYIVIDSPPINTVTDGVLLASMVDGVILVVHGGQAKREFVRRAHRLLQGVNARVLGVVLNNINIRPHDYYYQGYYGETSSLARPEAADGLLSVTH
jgi:succinoglycan biosynthesis transport protein ExoP